MFALQAEPLDPAALQRDLADRQAGAVVAFEGRVREDNAGQAVTSLEYEAAAPLAQKAWEPIERETRDAFDILEVHCVHRSGRLEVGDVAVWIGVLAAHRGAAFDACRYAIDELKKRLPVWKKEHYADGSTHWINCP